MKVACPVLNGGDKGNGSDRALSLPNAVTRGVPRGKVHPGSVTFIQRFGSALNLNEIVVDCVYLSEPLSSLL